MRVMQQLVMLQEFETVSGCPQNECTVGLIR